MIQISKKQAKDLWAICIDYLSQKTDIEAVYDLASDSTNPLLTDFPSIYLRLLESLSNRQGMPKSIGSVSRLSEVLFDFLPHKVSKEYGADWERLFRDIGSIIRPTSRMMITVPQNYWVVFSKGTIDSARFLSQFETAERYNDAVRQFAENSAFAAGLPKVLELEIRGFGFALACDFLKESGWSQYAKADVHTKKLLEGVGLADGTDYGTFKAMVKISRIIQENPYRVDKILWLIGSGNLYNRKESLNTSRKEFLSLWKQKRNG
jgi:hypothetical protein